MGPTLRGGERVAREPAAVVAMRRELGRTLARLRAAAGMTQVMLAERLHYSRSMLALLETGRSGASRAVWQRLDALVGADGVLVQAFNALSVATDEWARVGPTVDLVEQAFRPGAVIRWSGSVGSVRDAVGQWLMGSEVGVSVGGVGQERVGRGDVARLVAGRARLKALDNEQGGTAALPVLVEYVRGEIRPLLQGRYRDGTGDELFRVAAQVILDVGWAAYDAGAQPFARRCMRIALRLAEVAGDRLFGGRVLAALAHQSLHLGRNREAVDLAQAAVQGAGRGAGPHGVAMFEAMVACAVASVGDRASCEAALARAERALERADPGAVPGWLDFDGGGLAGHAARAYRDLGAPRRAERFAAEAVALCRGGHVRTQVQRKAILAAALAGAGEAEAACAVGQEVLDVAGELRSALVVSDLVKVSNVLGDGGDAGVFRQRVRDLVAAQRRGGHG